MNVRLVNFTYIKYIVGCQGVVQIGGPDPGFAKRGPTKVGACESILFTESSCVVEIKNIQLLAVVLLSD